MRKVFTDFHHSSLLRSLVLLFEDRLGMEVYRPIGLEWYEQGYWAINDQLDTAKQFLSLDQAYVPEDGTPPLNIAYHEREPGVHLCADPGSSSFHRAITLEAFKNTEFDFVIASIPEHVVLYQELIRRFQPRAKLIVQMGNNWDLKQYYGHNVLASTAPVESPGVNAFFYHQEFDLKLFKPTPAKPTRNIYSFVNVIEQTQGWEDYKTMRDLLKGRGFTFAAFGGQCPDGNMHGPKQLADKMREAQFVFHVKHGGDGFGHVIHNAYAVGRPVITRKSQYAGQLAEQLMVPGTYIDLDEHSYGEVKNMVVRSTFDPEGLKAMGKRAAERFREVVDYSQEAKGVWQWLETL